MRPTFLLFSLLSIFATVTESSRILNFLLRGGAQKRRVSPTEGLQVKTSNELDTPVITKPNTPLNSHSASTDLDEISIHTQESSIVTQKPTDNSDMKLNPLAAAISKKKVVPALDFGALNKMFDEEAELVAKAKDNRNLTVQINRPGKYVAEFIEIFEKNKKKINLDGLSEEGARELLKLKHPLNTVLNSKERIHLMLDELNFTLKVSDSPKEIVDKICDFDSEIASDLTAVSTLKEFLKVVLKFYNVCYKDLVLKDCVKYILAAEIYEIEEFPAVFEMDLNEIFLLACENGIEAVALKLVKRRTKGLDLVEGVKKALYANDTKLATELTRSIGEIYGTDSDSIYHKILYEITFDQLF